MRERTVKNAAEQMTSKTARSGQCTLVIARLDMKRLTHELTLRYWLVCHVHHNNTQVYIRGCVLG